MLNFQIALTNVPFDRQYKNVLRFEDREAQETFFDVSSLFLDAADVNFNIGSLLETTLIYTIKDNESINDLMSKNYCIVKDKNTNATLKYYYYFIKNAIHDSGNRQIKLWVELDIFQTYYIDLEFTDCEIMRANLNRFVEVVGDTTKVQFDGSPTSELFERENFQNVAKRLTKRTELGWNENILAGNVSARDWLKENVIGWLYCYLDPYKEINNVKGAYYVWNTNSLDPPSNPTTQVFPQLSTNNTPINFCVIAVPIYKPTTAKRIIVNVFRDLPVDVPTQIPVELSTYGLKKFLDANNGYTHIYGIKISCIPPFLVKYGGVVGDDLSITGAENDVAVTIEENGTYYGVLSCYEEWVNDFPAKELYTENYSLTEDFVFNKTDIVGANKHYKFNPKLLGSDYKELKISSYSTNGFVYDTQKLNKKTFSISVDEALSPETTKNYARIKNTDLGGIYIADTSKNFTGDVTNIDLTLPQITSYYQNAMAFQKNFFQQNEANRIVDFVKAIPRTISGDLMAIPNSIVNNFQSKMNQQFTVDNMKASPSLVENGSNGTYLSLYMDAIPIHIEEYDILDNEKEIINDQMCKYGFTYNKLGNIKNFDNIRKYYNYIQANVEETHGINISNAVHDLFVRCFADGVRFWNADEFDANNPFSYAKENYEKWLEN